MPIDWNATPVCPPPNKGRSGYGSVVEIESGWEWRVVYGDVLRKGVEKTRHAAMVAADKEFDVLEGGEA